MTLFQHGIYNESLRGSLFFDMKATNETEKIISEQLSALNKIGTAEHLEEWRVNTLGRQGVITSILKSISSLPAEECKAAGSAANQGKIRLQDAFGIKQKQLLANDSSNSNDSLDISLPGRPATGGKLHIITQTIREISSVFVSLGFQIEEGPEVEWGKYNFDMLNIPQDHPARDMWDTLWVEKDEHTNSEPLLLRTHTSPMQARIMEASSPPIRVIIPGKCYRYEATDATHEWQLTQIEGLAVDADISFADLKGTLYEFAKRIFGQDRQVRFRCDYFPFVEPGVDMSIDCFKCSGKGCSICSHTGWIEILGAGMVHPNVFKGVNYDPDKYKGFAFGMGVERIAMLKYEIDDIRNFYANDLRFLSQF